MNNQNKNNSVGKTIFEIIAMLIFIYFGSCIVWGYMEAHDEFKNTDSLTKSLAVLVKPDLMNNAEEEMSKHAPFSPKFLGCIGTIIYIQIHL